MLYFMSFKVGAFNVLVLVILLIFYFYKNEFFKYVLERFLTTYRVNISFVLLMNFWFFPFTNHHTRTLNSL